MNAQKRRLLLVATLLVSCFAQAIRAEDFNITVPVNISRVPPNVTTFGVRCFAVVMPAGAAAPTEQIGFGAADQTLSGGAFSGNLVVRFNASPGKTPNSATHYKCSGQFQGTDRGFSVGYFVNGSDLDRPFPRAPGSSFNLNTGWRPLPP
jgi:hypothetical protein